MKRHDLPGSSAKNEQKKQKLFSHLKRVLFAVPTFLKNGWMLQAIISRAALTDPEGWDSSVVKHRLRYGACMLGDEYQMNTVSEQQILFAIRGNRAML
ncbi:MAG: hypothetical protein B7X58_15910 [Marinobacter sp. 34-60-7]|nr:MAG: hypothetical protein B7X58_15910 [Marinobacter sp. 34-60-7]